MKNTTTKQRLDSLDILRGFDLFMLVFLQPILVGLLQKIDNPAFQGVLNQLDHEVWTGFRAWDLVMPLFLFMAGAAMPFSFQKYRLDNNKWPIYKRIFRRVFLLFVLGAVVQGNLLGLNPRYLYLYTNTLQAIGVGYLIAAIIQLHLPTKGQLIATALLLLAYWAPMTFLGDFTPEGNFAEKVDRFVLGRFRDGVYWNEDGSWSFSPNYNYTWILSSLTFGVTVMMGAFAGKIMKDGKDKLRNVRTLLIVGAVSIIIALIWSLQMPIIKRIWTCSMTLYAGGISFMLMGLFYYWIDCKQHTKGLKWLKIYGMNSITAYVLGEIINFRSVVQSVCYGFEQYLGNYYSVLINLGNYLIVFFILRELYKRGIFLKV